MNERRVPGTAVGREKERSLGGNGRDKEERLIGGRKVESERGSERERERQRERGWSTLRVIKKRPSR